MSCTAARADRGTKDSFEPKSLVIHEIVEALEA
jgi:hypothetical protein